MIIELDNVFAKVVQATDAEHEYIGEYLSWSDESAFHRRKYGYRGDGMIRLYNRIYDTYPAGFTRMLAKAASTHGFTAQVKDVRVMPAQPFNPPPDLSWLRDYQLSAVQDSIARTRGIIWAATGAGKTEIACGLVESVPINWLFVVHRTQLGLQARDRYKLRTGQDAGVIAEGEQDLHPGGHGLTVATFQTLYAGIKRQDPIILNWLNTVQGVIVDECHVLPADTFRAVLDHQPNAYWRIGLSGTPLARGDRKSMHLIGCLGSVICRISAKQLIDAGVLTPPTIRMVPCHQVGTKKTWAGVYTELISQSKVRNRLICDLAQKAVKPCVVFVKTLKQGRILEKTLQKRGEKVEYLDGNAHTSTRQNAVVRLERGDIDILVVTVIMNEGVDIPQLRSVVMAAGGASPIEALQRVGRGTRKVSGKTGFDVWDINDTGDKWTERHAKARIRAYGVEEYEVQELDSAP